MKKFFKGIKNRTIALMLTVLLTAGVLPAAWTNTIAADAVQCGIEEHSHNQECYKIVMNEMLSGSDIAEDKQEGDIFSVVLVCEKEEHSHSGDCITVSETDKIMQSETDTVLPMAQITSVTDFAPAPTEVTTSLYVSGIWDVEGKTANGSVDFDTDTAASIDHDGNLASETVKVRISAAFPEGTTSKQVKITLEEGLEWFTNGAESIPAGSLESVSSLSGESRPYAGVKLGNGSYTYNFTDGVGYVDIDIMVKKSYKTNFPLITDAIKAEVSCEKEGTKHTEVSSLRQLRPEQVSYVSRTYHTNQKNVKPDEEVYDYTAIVMHTYTGNGFSNYRLYDFAEVTVEAPADIEFVDASSGRDGTSIGFNSVSGWELVSQNTENNITTYIFRVEKFYEVAIGISTDWIIPSSAYGDGDEVKIYTKDLKWKLYGDDEVYVYNKTGTQIYKVVDPNKKDEIVTVSAYSHNILYDNQSPDAVYQMTGWYLENTGSDPSAPKVVEFEFDYENIGVTDVCMLLPEKQKITTVWYKLKSDVENGDDTWKSAKVSKSVTGKAGRLDNSIVSVIDMGLSEDDYLAAFKYELDFLSNNGTPSDTSDDYRYGLPEVAKASGNGGYHPIAGVNLNLSAANTKSVSTVRVYDKVEEGQPIINDTGRVKLTATCTESLQNHVQVDNTSVVTSGSGDTFTVKSVLSANRPGSTSLAFCVGFTHYPIIYIRDETGEGITNVQLKNNDGVDVLSAYSEYVTLELAHTETEDHNGDGRYAKVYKIDTTGLRNADSKEVRYAAAVGFFHADSKMRKLTLSYNVTTPSTYGDSQTKHYIADAIMFSDLSAEKRKASNGRAVLKDPFDVDQDGSTSTKVIYQPLDTYTTGYYEILSRNDISVSLSAKKASDSEYTSWDGTDNYIKLEPDVLYNIKAGVFNGAGVTTSTNPDELTYVYIPVPKEGEDWGPASKGIDGNGNAVSAFTFSTSLAGAVNNPNPSVFTVDYGYVNTAAFGSASVSNIGAAIKNSSTSWSSSYSGANCIRITISGMPASVEADDFIIPLVADADTIEDNEVNIFSAIYYEDMTNDHNQNFTGWFSSDEMAIQVVWGGISGVVWEDANGNGIRDSGEKLLPSVAVDISAVQSAVLLKGKAAIMTDENGKYSVGKLPSGTYTVTFTGDFSDYTVSSKNEGTNDGIDCDCIGKGDSEAIAENIVIPGKDSVGKPVYGIENIDLGLVPNIEVTYNWSGDVPGGAVKPADEVIAAGTEYTAEKAAAVHGYTFDGWYTDEERTQKHTDGTKLLEDTELYGTWTINSYDVEYTWNNAPAGAVKPAADTVDYNTKYTSKYPNPVTGYTFDGWYTDEERTAKFEDGTAITEDTELYGNWTINQYKVTWNADGTKTEESYDFGEGITKPSDPEKTGYTFAGWDKEIPTAMPAENLEFKATWTINSYDVEYTWTNAPTGAVKPAADTVDYNTKYTSKYPNPVTGYTFDGWYTDEERTAKFEDGTAITEDTELFGKWTRNTVSIRGRKIWVENGAGFNRPEYVTVNLFRNEELLDSRVLPKDESKSEQEFTFNDLYECDESGNKYVYTVKEAEVPENYISMTSGYDITNTYNVNSFIIRKEWDHTGNPDAYPESTVVNLWCDDAVIKSVTLNDSNSFTETVTLPRLETEGHVFRIEECLVEGYITEYSEPEAEDTDSDGKTDTVTYVIKNTFDMPKITVSGIKTWEDVPKGSTVPDVTVNLMVDGTVIDTCVIASETGTYRFTDLDRYNSDGSICEYTVEEVVPDNYAASYSAAVTDADGNIVIDITNKGTFTYGTLTVSNEITGEDAPEGDIFEFTVTLGSDVEYEYTGAYSGTIKNGDVIRLGSGESITISGILTGVPYKVETEKKEFYTPTPSDGIITGVISSVPETAAFINNHMLPPNGILEISNKVTGDLADKEEYFSFRIDIDSDREYKCVIGERALTVKNGDVIELRHGETAIIQKIFEGTAYNVVELDAKGYKMTSTGTSGVMTAYGAKASFINTKKSAVLGDSDAPKTGDDKGELIAVLIMQTALLAMLYCIYQRRSSGKRTL